MSQDANAAAVPTKNQTLDQQLGAVSSEEIRRREREVQPPDPAERGAAAGPASLGKGGFGKVDDHSGAYRYSVPVYVPPPQNGGPKTEISLDYNSMSSARPSLLAAGWRLELGRITRQGELGSRVQFTNDQGADGENDHFILVLNGETYTLVNVFGQPDLFRVKLESSFAEARRIFSRDVLDPDSGEPVIDSWQVFLADGTVCLFRQPDSSAADGPASTAGQLLNKTWEITECRNVHGQKTIYRYETFRGDLNPDELEYSYPTRIRAGVTPDGAFDSEIVFVYTDRDMPDEEFGYYDLTASFTGRPSTTCVIRRRLTGVRSLFRDQQGQMQIARQLEISASLSDRDGIFVIDRIDELAFKNGEPDASADLPPHRFSYTSRGEANPALLTRVRTPMGKIDELAYALANDPEVDPRSEGMTGILLVESYTERCLDESWTKKYEYRGGKVYTPFDEFRGHELVRVSEQESGLVTESTFEQNGVHNGYVKDKKSFAADGNLISHETHRWMAFDYGGARFLPFDQRSVVRRFAEDGATVLSTVVQEIPEDPSRPSGFAVDDFSNPLRQLKSFYAGDQDRGEGFARQLVSVFEYLNVTTGEHRLIGLPTHESITARGAAGEPEKLIRDVTTSYDDRGQVIERAVRFDRDDPLEVFKTTFEYDPFHGKEVRRFRHDGERRILDQETRYYPDDHPQRHLAAVTGNALGQETAFERYDLQSRAPSRTVGIDGIAEEVIFDGLGRPIEESRVASRFLSADGSRETVRHVYTISEDRRSIETRHLGTGATTLELFDPLQRKFETLASGYEGRQVSLERTVFDAKTRKPAIVDEPHFADQPSPGARIIRYDEPRLRQSEMILANGSRITYAYDGLRKTTREHVFDRGADGRVAAEPIHVRVEDEEEDIFGQIVRRAEGTPGTGGFYESRSVSDVQDRLLSTSDNLGVVLQRFDFGSRMDRLPIRVDDVSLGVAEKSYDGLGRLVEARRGAEQSGRISHRVYDDLDRMVLHTEEDPATGTMRETRAVFDSQPEATGRLSEHRAEENGPGGVSAHLRRLSYDGFGSPATELHDWHVDWPDLGVRRDLELSLRTVHDGTKAGRLERLEHGTVEGHAGGVVDYRYDDPSGLPTEVLLDGETLWQVGEEGYTARQQVIATRHGNGITTDHDYQPETGLVTAIATTGGNASLLDLKLDFDTSGNVRRKRLECLSATGGDQAVLSSIEHYTYDDKHQLLQALEPEGGGEEFSYQADGRRAASSRGQEQSSFDYDQASPHQVARLSGATERELAYDPEGRLVEDVNTRTGFRRRLSWTPSNRLHQLEFLDSDLKPARTLRYSYGGSNERSVMFDSQDRRLVFYLNDEMHISWQDDELSSLRTHVFLGDGEEPSGNDKSLEKERPTGETQAKKAGSDPAADPGSQPRQSSATAAKQGEDQGKSGPKPGSDQETGPAPAHRRIASMERDVRTDEVKIYHLHRDHLSSICAVSDETGDLSNTTLYHPFGAVSFQSGPYTPDILYTGQRADFVVFEGFRLYDYGARVYDPELGIFLSPDTEDDTRNAAFGLNRYAYVGNNPLCRFDPSGHWFGDLLKDLLKEGGNRVAKVVIKQLRKGKGRRFVKAIPHAETLGAIVDVMRVGEAARRGYQSGSDWKDGLVKGAQKGFKKTAQITVETIGERTGSATLVTVAAGASTLVPVAAPALIEAGDLVGGVVGTALAAEGFERTFGED